MRGPICYKQIARSFIYASIGGIQMRVGFIYSSATNELLAECPELTLNLTDSEETIQAVAKALEEGGHVVTRLNADRHLPASLVDKRFDIVFNIATWIYGDMRQPNRPAMLEYL